MRKIFLYMTLERDKKSRYELVVCLYFPEVSGKENLMLT